MRRVLFTFSLLLCFSNVHLPAQVRAINELWRWVHFTTQSGLPSNRVFQMYETPAGDVWAATQSGLAWYNGYYWQTIDSSHGLPSRIASTMIGATGDSVFVLMDYRLYVGTTAGFRNVPVVYKSQPLNIASIAPFKADSFLVLGDSTLFILHDYSLTPYICSQGLDTSRVLNFWHTKGGYIWVNTFKGLYRYEQGGWKLKIKVGSLPLYFANLRENKNGCGFAMINSPMEFFGIWEWDESGEVRYIKSEGLNALIAFDIAPNNDAILIKESGDVRMREHGVWSTITNVPDQFQMINAIQYCSDGNLWLSTEKGLYLNKVFSKRWTNWRFDSRDMRNSINAILRRNDGSVWIATGGGLVIRYPDGHVETTTHIFSVSLAPLTGLAEDRDGNIWISSGAGFAGAFCWNGTSWKQYGYREGLDAGVIHKIVKDHQGRLWFLGLLRRDFEQRNVAREPGAYLLEDGKFIPWGPKEGLLGGRVFTFADEPDGTLWFGTSAGLSRHTPNGQWKYWSMKNGLATNRIFTIALDAHGTLWFGDQASGIGNIQNDSIKYFTDKDGLISNNVWNIQIDQEGRLWIATRSGVSVFSQGVWSKFDGKDGMENVRVWPMVVDSDKVYFGTYGGGVEILNLNEIRKEPPVIVLSQPVIKENSVSVECRPYAYWNEQEPVDISIRYRIDTFSWSSWTTKRNILCENLASGDHTIEFQAMGVLGSMNQKIWSRSFFVERPFYQQIKFILPVGFLLVAVITIAAVFINKKRIQDKSLRMSELRYRNLFENTTDPIIVFDPETIAILEINKKVSEIYGYRKSDLVNQPVGMLSKDFDNERQYIRFAIDDNTIQEFETYHLKKSGAEFPVRVNMSVVEYDGKSVILSIIRDISAQLQAEAKIRLLAQTVASAQDYVSITDLDNNILFVNDSFTKAYGYSLAEIYGKHISLLRSFLTPLDVFENVYTSTQTGGWNGELYNRRKDSSEFLVELWTSPVCNEEGKPVAFVGVARDITERKRAEKEREDLINNLKEAIAEVKTLSGLLPICSSCKKIRDDQGYWTQVETYIAKYSDATFTHGLCPDCLKEYFPEVYNRMQEKKTDKQKNG
jgi:PAS domain S-box-containing protein